MSSSSVYITFSFFRGWLVTFASSAIGLVLGILYVWSVVKAGIPASWGWTNADKALPYSIMCIVFSIMMVPAGRLQDRYGPRWLVFFGGFLAGLGCIVSGLGGDSVIAYILGFGVLTGAGVGFGYSALTPASIKWFPAEKTGLVTGIVVAGFGLAPVPLAPLSSWLLNVFEKTNQAGVLEKGVSMTMMILGVGIWLVVGIFAWFILNPPIGFIASSTNSMSANVSDKPEMAWRQMLKTAQFWLLFIMYFSGASAGLVFISVAIDLGKSALGHMAFLAVVVLAIGNTFGRIIAGVISDKIGRQLTLFAEFIWQALMIATLFYLSLRGGGTWVAILGVVFMIGMNYGSNLTIFPAACKEYFGIRNFGLNYGCLFTAFGLAGLIMPWVNGLLRDLTGKPDYTYILIIFMMVVSAVLSLVSRFLGPPVPKTQ